GRATAFDRTALALILAMIVMFVGFVVDRLEQGALQAVDDYVQRQLAHRFERTSAESAPFLEALRLHSQTLLEAVEQLVKQQAAVWAQSLAVVEQRQVQEQQKLTVALQQAMESRLQEHTRQAASLQEQAVTSSAKFLEQMSEFHTAVRAASGEQQEALGRVAESFANQGRVLTGLQAGEQKL